jgi:hypothetical protein
MQYPRVRISESDSKQERAILWKCLMVCAIGFAIGALLTVPRDYGHYAEVHREWGLVGFLGMPSLLLLQIGILYSAVSFLWLALVQDSRTPLRVMAWLLGGAAAIYCLSLFMICRASQAGEFGIGTVGFFLLFGFLPSVAFILIGLPISVIYALCGPREKVL